MKQLNKTETVIFLIGGIVMTIGAGLYVFMLQQKVAAVLFLLGALAFATMQYRQRDEGTNQTILRLRRIQNIANILFVISGLLMIDSCFQFLAPLFSNRIDYIQFVYNKWVMTLLIAAVLEIYTVHRLSAEISKIKKS